MTYVKGDWKWTIMFQIEMKQVGVGNEHQLCFRNELALGNED